MWREMQLEARRRNRRARWGERVAMVIIVTAVIYFGYHAILWAANGAEIFPPLP